ncbi:MAG: SAM-dependent methyltransferase [Clostridiales bacterium]|nr:SAM-dependent methyltransferase [Clostridiales bacterium]
MDRIDKLCAYLDPCESFADIGCDHGYCTRYMLENNLCKSAVISDISEKCLDKAKRLLSAYIAQNRVKAVCCNGLSQIDENTGQVLIAGMGGEEIIAILKNSFIPKSFVFQPMKNVRLVREYLISCGAEISTDEYFESGGKFYSVIKGKKNGLPPEYTAVMLEFGKNISCGGTRKFIAQELDKKRSYLERNLGKKAREDILRQIKFMEEVLSSENK